MKLVPGQSEHEMVQYKAGYAMGPSNPHPENEAEAEILKDQRKVEETVEAFEELKRQSELEKKERQEMFKKKQLDLKKLPMIPPGTEDDAEMENSGQKSTKIPGICDEPMDPNDPNNYELPEHLKNDPAFSNDRPLEFGRTAQLVLPPGEEEEELKKKQQENEIENKNADVVEETFEGAESQEFSEEKLPKMKPLEESTTNNEEPSSSSQNVGDMALHVAMEMEEKRKREARERIMEGAEEEGDHDEIIYSLDEITKMNEASRKNKEQGPELNESNIQEILKQKTDENAKVALDAYWQFVRENPQDFNGWCYLVQHAENMDDLNEVRTVYNAFLPLYPYCYAYWQRYSDIEKKHEHWQRALAILHRGLEAIPLSVDLWLSYLELYQRMYETHDNFDDMFRVQCERAIQTVGLDYHSDPLWDFYLDWEMGKGHLKWVTSAFKRVIGIPTKLYNKHWDNFVAHVRNHHPRDILEYEEYEDLRKVTCEELELTYRPDPVIEPVKPRTVVQPEDKLKAGMKERIVASVVAVHEKCEEEVDKRFRFEDKIKRTYFHVKPLDLKQLKNWDSYLDFEIAEGDHERIVVLFERCLIPCAQYEQFWAKYARYMDNYCKDHRNNSKRQNFDKVQKSKSDSPLKKARWAFGTGLTKVDEVREKRCTWTLRGWKETDEEGNEIMVAEEIPSSEVTKKSSDDKGKDSEIKNGVEEKENQENRSLEEEAQLEEPEKEPFEKNTEVTENDKDQQNAEFHQQAIDKEMFDVLKTSSNLKEVEAVRDIYKRACIIHCAKKAMIHLRWAAFEEENENLEKAKEILINLNNRYPLMLECCMQLIDLERRSGNIARAEELYKILIKKIPQNRKSIKTWVSMKLARFQFKVCGQADKALSTLRAALKKERGEAKLYTQIIDVCYQRYPLDVKGVKAAIELALKSPDLKHMQKLEFAKRKVEFMQEFGDVKNYRDACDQIRQYKHLCAVDLKIEAKRKRELEREEQKLQELETIKAQVRAETNMKAKIAEAEGRLICTNCQASMFPDAEGTYEFEHGRFGRRTDKGKAGQVVEEEEEDEYDGVIDLMDMEIPEDQEEQIRKTLQEKTKYKEVAPTWELNMETYGYGKKRKVYDPDYEHVESSKFREYERLEGEGYDDSLKDPDHDKLRNINAPGLGSTQVSNKRHKPAYTSSDYIVPPKVPQLQMGPGIGPSKPNTAPGKKENFFIE